MPATDADVDEADGPDAEDAASKPNADATDASTMD